MEKEFVPYEEALELKELGFDEPCIGWATMSYPDVVLCGYRFKKYHETELPTRPFSVPLYQQAFRWFRKKHDVKVVSIGGDEKKKYNFLIVLADNKQILGSESTYNSYEEAELDCLRKLIKIVKNG